MKLFFTSHKLQVKKGFSLVEALLAVTIFALLTTAIVGGILYGQESTALSGTRTRANFIAEEGLEAVRSMRDSTVALPTDSAPTYGLTSASNKWAFSGIQDVVDGLFTRKVTVSTVDANTKKVSVNVSWQQNTQRAGNVLLESQLTNWKTPTVIIGKTMMVYSKSTNIPYYRIWDGTSWGGENSATAVGVGGNIQYLVLKFSRTRNEAILGTLDSLGDIRVQTWDGSTWGSTTLVSNIGTTNDAYQGFDIDYETSGDRAVIVYNNANSVDPAYRIWDGNNWSGASTISTPPTTGIPYWIELAENPISSSNEIAMMMLDSNLDTYGMTWNGSTWGTMGTSAVWDATCAIATKKVIDIAYEQISGNAMFIWGDSVSTDQYYRIWNGTTLTAATLLDITTMGGVANWVRLVSRPNSNEIIYGVNDQGADLNTRKWLGTAWDTVTQHPEHDATLENITSPNFDIAFESYPVNNGKAWMVWGDGATVSSRQWSGTAWGAITTFTGSDDTSFVKLHANPGSGAFFAGIYEASTSATDDISEWHLAGGSSTWSTEMTVWGGPISADPVMSRIDFATERN